jgi:hypothetical protein
MEFSDFQQLNWRRCEKAEKFDKTWPVDLWALAIAGEAGGLYNRTMEVRRGDYALLDARQDILEKVADVITYCDLLMSSLGAETDVEVMREFNIVSERVGWKR